MTHLRVSIPRSAAELIMAMPLSDAESRAASEEYISQMEALTFAYVITPIVSSSGYTCGYVLFYASGLTVAARTSADDMLHILARSRAVAAPSPEEAVLLFEQAVTSANAFLSDDDLDSTDNGGLGDDGIFCRVGNREPKSTTATNVA